MGELIVPTLHKVAMKIKWIKPSEVLSMCLALRRKCVLRDLLLPSTPPEPRLHSCHLYGRATLENSLMSPSKFPERSGSRQAQLRLNSKVSSALEKLMYR